MGDTTLDQQDFSAGIYRGRKAPRNAVYDALNALVDDEGQLFKRGGSAYRSTSNVTGNNLIGLADANLSPGARTVMWDTTKFTVLDDSNAPVTFTSPHSNYPYSRMVGAGPYLIGILQAALTFYAGSLKTNAYSTGTVSVTNGSKTVTGAGTTWSTNVDPGMILGTTSPVTGVVETVNSNTSITLRDPYLGATAAGIAYTFGPVSGVNLSTTITPLITDVAYIAAVGTPARLVVLWQNRAFFSPPGQPWNFPASDYHELPSTAWSLGADALGNNLVLFTTDGVYVVTNMELDAVDDFGNVQQSVEHVNQHVVLWGDPGIAGWEGRLIVPAIDDVYLFALGQAPVPISGDPSNEKIRPLYRSYVKAGYQPGRAVVHRGHYFLPIIDVNTSTTVAIDMLVCRLDRGAAWTRWSGHAASGTALAVRASGVGTRTPKLFGIAAKRVTDLTSCLDGPGSVSTDADGTTPAFQVDTVDFDTGPGPRPNTVEKVRVTYEAAGTSPSTSLSWAIGPEGSAFTAATVLRGGAASDGTGYSAFRVGKKTKRARFRFSCSSTVTSLILHDFQLTIRQVGGS